MTVTVNDATIQYTASGGETTFNYDFLITDSSHLTVDLDGTTLTETTHYTVAGVGNGSGGSITLAGAYVGGATASQIWTLQRDIPIARAADYSTSGDFRAVTVNAEQDKQIQIMQELSRDIDTKVGRATNDTETFSLNLPATGFDTTPRTIVMSTDAGIEVGPATTDISSAAANAAAAAASAAAASTSETNAGTSETNAAASAAAAAAAAASNLFSKVLTKAADYTIVADTDDGTMFVCDMTSGNVDFDLPSIATAGEGERYGFLRSGASNSLTFTRNGTDTINGVAGTFTVDAVDGAMLIIIADDASPDNWLVVPWSQVEAGAGLTKSGGSMTLDLTNDNTWTGDQTFGPITETQTTKATSFTPSLTAEGTIYNCNAAITITMPTATAGKGFTIIHDDGTEITWSGTILWAGGAAPTAAAAKEIYVFVSDGTNWYGNLVGTGYA